MSTSVLRYFLLIVFGGAWLTYSGIAAFKYYEYWRISSSVEPSSLNWVVIKKNEESFYPATLYGYKNNNLDYTGKTLWSSRYLNEWTASEAIERLKKVRLNVWFDATEPEISTLERIFPLKSIVYSIILFFLFVYFAVLTPNFCLKK